MPTPGAHLTEAQAQAAMDRHFRELYPPKGGLTFSHSPYGKPELGWAFPEGGGPARLAWRIPFVFEERGEWTDKGVSNGMLVDATTGAQIKTSVVP